MDFTRGVGLKFAMGALGCALAIVFGLLVLNPGYFSHDELQWGAFAAASTWHALPWQDLGDVAVYQYRPITFDAWLILSRLLFGTPRLMHAVWLLLGIGNAALLFVLLRRLTLPRWHAVAGAALFLLCPYAAFVHGWVATLADLLWVGIGLGLFAWMTGQAEPSTRAGRARLSAFGAIATALALLCKESALSLPLLLLVAAFWSRQPRIAWTAVGSGVAALAYVALRAGVVLGAEPSETGYAWSAMSMPVRFVEYHLFPFDVRLLEVVSFPRERTSLRVASLLLCLVAYWLAFRNRRTLGWFLAGSAAALGPVLLLEQASSQYGYAFAALAAAVFAGCWRGSSLRSRTAILVIAGCWAVHSLVVGATMHRVGVIQSRLLPAVAATLAARDRPILVVPRCAGDAWIYRRLLHRVPAYNGVPFGNRVRVGSEPTVAGSHMEVLAIDCHGNLDPPSLAESP